MTNATITINRPCSRCPRVDRREVSPAEAAKMAKAGLAKDPSMVVTMDGEQTFSFENLCGTCQQIVENTLAKLCKRLDQRSSVREKKAKAEPKKTGKE